MDDNNTETSLPVISLSEDLTVNQSNELLYSQYDLPINQWRIIMLALTKINSSKPNSGVIAFTSNEFSEKFGLHISGCASIIRRAIDSINKSPIKMPYKEISDDGREEQRYKTFHWFTETDTPAKNDSVFRVTFSDQIAPYLFELEKHYSKLDFDYIRFFKNNFQFRLYQWLKEAPYMKDNKFKRIDINNWTVCIDVDFLKDKTNISGYERFADFNNKILSPAINIINDKTNISVTYEGIRAGKKITSIRFFVYQKDNTIDKSIDELPKVKPTRRLKRRGKFINGSHEHGEWARHNIKILLKYEKELKQYNKKERLPIADLKRLIEYYEVIGSVADKEIREEQLKQRQFKS